MPERKRWILKVPQSLQQNPFGSKKLLPQETAISPFRIASGIKGFRRLSIDDEAIGWISTHPLGAYANCTAPRVMHSLNQAKRSAGVPAPWPEKTFV